MQPQYITTEHLNQLGINLDGQDVDQLLAHLNEQLEERVGTEVTEALDDRQLEELVKLQESASEDEVGAWIENIVGADVLQQIVEDERDILLGDLAENADGINENK